MGQNLTGKLIKDTYEDLVQISGSILTDGTGSDITSLTVTASLATTASYAISSSADNLTLQDVTDNGNVTDNFISSSAGFIYKPTTNTTAPIQIGDLANAGTTIYFESERDGLDQIRFVSSTSTNAIILDGSGSQNVRIDFNSGPGEIEASGDLTLDTQNLGDVIIPSGSLIVTGSVTATTGFTGSLEGTASQATNANNADQAELIEITGTGTNANYRVLFASSNGFQAARIDSEAFGFYYNPSTNALAGLSGVTSTNFFGNATTATTASYALNAGTSGLAVTASLALDLDAAADISISSISASNATFVSASIGYLTAVTGSVTKIGDAFILLNTSDVTRYAGLLVEDSGSATPINYTASFFFDSETNDWNYEYTSGSTDYGVALFGPTYNTKGVPTYLTANRIPKAEGTHHLVDTNISDDGTTVSINSNTEVTGSLIVSGGITGLVSSASLAENANKVYVSGSSEAALLPVVLGSNGDVDTYTSTKVDAGANLGYDPNASTLYSPTFSGNLTGNADTATTASYASTALSASYAVTASYALNAGGAGFPYTGSAEISGSLRVLVDGTADGYTITSGSLTGSLIDNLGTPTSSEAIKHIVYLSQTEYNALTPDGNTMYVISGSGDVVENLIVSSSLEVSGSTILSGSLVVTGASTLPSIVGPTAITGSLIISGSTTITGSLVGNVTALSISSNTASMDLNRGNFFTLQLVAGTDTRIEPSNIKAGQTVNLLLSTTGSATVSFPSSVKQVSGSSYVPTTTTSKDVVTFISFDNTALYLSNVKNLV